MRILTSSPFETKGLISIYEASDNVPQVVMFCIPIDKREAQEITSLVDFQRFFSNGISTKIKDGEITNTIYLDYVSRIDFGKQVISLPKFVTSVKGHKIDFFLSLLNFNSKRNGVLDIDYFYSGDRFYKELGNKRLVIVEPNWGQLDKLFLEEKVVFTDWK
tara:strand:- start:1123 stop:1605 length:483 start_codon:yes stop_codon:yes gene_type:complete